MCKYTPVSCGILSIVPPSCPKSVVAMHPSQLSSEDQAGKASIAHLPVVSQSLAWLHDSALVCLRSRPHSREAPTTTTTTTNPTRHHSQSCYVSNRRTTLLTPLFSAASSSSSSRIVLSSTTAAVRCCRSRNLAHRVRRRGARLPSTSSFGAAGQNLLPRVRTEILALVPAAGQEEATRPTAALLFLVLLTTPHRPPSFLPSASACPRPARNSSSSSRRRRIAPSSQRRGKKGSVSTSLGEDSLPPACQGRTCWRSPLLPLQQVRH